MTIEDTTTAHDTTTNPTPAWLDLDSIVSPELRGRIHAAVAALQVFLDDDRFETACRAAYEVTCEYETALLGFDSDDDMIEDAIGRATRYSDLWQVAGSLASMVQVAIGDRPTYVQPKWYRGHRGEAWIERHGDNVTEYLLVLGRPHEWPTDEMRAWAEGLDDAAALAGAAARVREWAEYGVPADWLRAAGDWSINVAMSRCGVIA